MRVLLVHDEVYEYLVNVVGSYAGAGINPDELAIAAELWRAVKAAKSIDFSKLGKAELEAIGPKGVSLNIPVDQPECQACFEEEGSMACVRPAHKGRQIGPVEGT